MTLSTAVSPSQVARTVGIETLFKNLQGDVVLLPQRLAVECAYGIENSKTEQYGNKGTLHRE